jgi:hypothetical protein
MKVFDHLLEEPLARGPYDGLAEWLTRLEKCPFQATVKRALWGGLGADRLGYAFVAGYDAAIRQLFDHAASAQRRPSAEPFPAPLRIGIASLAASETGGAHPRAIATRLDSRDGTLVLTGDKTFATLATVADELLVVATRGKKSDGNSDLCVVRVSPNAPGVRVEARAETPFAPEIPHAHVHFETAVVDAEDVLPGDGYQHWLKPFRTIEDVHVLASTIGYLTGVARAHAWDREVIAELASLSLALVDLGGRDPNASLTHILLAGLFAQTRRLIGALGPQWAKSDAGERARWERDVILLSVAENARLKRTASAWRNLDEAGVARAARRVVSAS